MTSLRTRLLVSLFSALTLAGIGAGGGVYLKAYDEANVLLDYQLRQTALSLRDHAATSLVTSSDNLGDPAQEIVIQIWDDEGVHLYTSHPGMTAVPQTAPGLTTVTTGHSAWHVFTLQEDARMIQVAQPLRIRQTMAAEMAMRILIPWLVAMPVLCGLMWWLVGRGLQPLSNVADAVRTRTPQALDPLPTTTLPQEITPLVVALNDLLARLATALTAQRAFMSDAAHALRTPLTAVHLQAQVVARATGEDERQQAIQSLQHGIQRATHLVEQLLTMARFEPDTAERPLTLVALNSLIHEIIAEQTPIAVAQGIDMGLVRDDPAPIMGDVDGLRGLFGNLIENALRYTLPGGIVDIQLCSTPTSICVEVSDTGPGIPPPDRLRVFDRFYRCQDTSVPGNGLGLAIVKASAERHHAQVTMGERENGTGLVVRVTFPRA